MINFKFSISYKEPYLIERIVRELNGSKETVHKLDTTGVVDLSISMEGGNCITYKSKARLCIIFEQELDELNNRINITNLSNISSLSIVDNDRKIYYFSGDLLDIEKDIGFLVVCNTSNVFQTTFYIFNFNTENAYECVGVKCITIEDLQKNPRRKSKIGPIIEYVSKLLNGDTSVVGHLLHEISEIVKLSGEKQKVTI